MLLNHQCGHNFNWNLSSYLEDKTGDGLILSPVNIDSEKIIKLDIDIKSNSIFDPQFYLIDQPKSKLSTYSFFPGNIKNDFNTSDLTTTANMIAANCIQYQYDNKFKYITIPARYFDVLPTRYYDQYKEFIITPFLNVKRKQEINAKLLLTLIIKPSQLVDEEAIEQIITWITSIDDIDGVYLIFENNYTSKQIKNTEYLYNVLLFIHYLKLNALEIHIGYNNTEGILYSIAFPDSISMGSYDNLRKFKIKRFEKAKSKQAAPRARLYIDSLLQWIDYGYLGALKRLPNFMDLFVDTKYKPLIFEPNFNWHFQKPEPYKHFFILFDNQVKQLPNGLNERVNYVEKKIDNALSLFRAISDNGIYLDDDSDGGHLYHWKNALNMFKKYIDNNQHEF